MKNVMFELCTKVGCKFECRYIGHKLSVLMYTMFKLTATYVIVMFYELILIRCFCKCI